MNVGVITALYPQVIFSDDLNHMSIAEGTHATTAETIRYEHADPEDLRQKVAARYEEADGDTDGWLIITESVYSFDGDIPPLAEICDVAEEYDIAVMVDEAHATGLYKDGGGVIQDRGLGDRVDFQTGTLSKALASQGGYVAGPDELITYLSCVSRSFAYSAGLSPAAAAAARAALNLAKTSDRAAELHERADYMRDRFETAGFTLLGSTHIVPLLIQSTAETKQLVANTRKRGVIINGVSWPVVDQGESRVRIAPMPTHSYDQIDECINVITDEAEKLDII